MEPDFVNYRVDIMYQPPVEGDTEADLFMSGVDCSSESFMPEEDFWVGGRGVRGYRYFYTIFDENEDEVDSGELFPGHYCLHDGRLKKK